MTKHILSPIAIDLGGKNTGLYLTQYAESELPTHNHAIASTLVLPDDGKKMTWSQTARTATRHRIRSNKRRKLAKRLLKVVIEQGFRYPLNSKEWEALRGLLNRRGYNRLEVDIDLDALSQTSPTWFAEQFPAFFHDQTPLNTQWDDLTEDIHNIRDLYQHTLIGLNKKAQEQQVKATLSTNDSGEIKRICKALTTITDSIASIITEIDSGAKHRRDYLRNIRDEISKDSRLQNIKNQLGEEPLYRIIGHISNFQLRTLRWYFNNEAHKASDYYDATELHNTITRWLEGWHPSDQEREARKQLLAAFESNQNPLDVLIKQPPELTIPPYEDQNNRRPPKDQTLWLSPRMLVQRYGERWNLWAHALRSRQPEWAEQIDNIIKLYDRNHRRKKTTEAFYTPQNLKDSYFLQRILDRSKALDPYALRRLSLAYSKTQPLPQALNNAYDRLQRDIGSQHTEDFLAFCQHYYQETEAARNGLWYTSPTTQNLLEKSDLNPPQKKRILHTLVGNILGIELTEEALAQFCENLWRSRIKGNRTLKGYCTVLEETRKEFGNLFNEQLKRLNYLIETGKKDAKKLTTNEKALWQANEYTHIAANAIQQYFGQTDTQKARFSNTYSMAQLYTLLETDRNGFSKISVAAHQETNWRMQTALNNENEPVVRCSRLPADSVRPFDGVLKRILERQAFHIAQQKAAQVKHAKITNGRLTIPVLIEENRFEFSLGLAELKKSPKTKRDKIQQQLTKQGSPWADKNERIKTASQNTCPYTGKPIGDKGEIDHIVPRAFSTNQYGTVFNSEANLIWCTRAGNRQKRDIAYTLTDLHQRYLMAIYGTSNCTDIEQQIHQTLNTLPKSFTFDTLDTHQLRDLRHALFLRPENPVRETAERLLATQQKARVNGTQAWLVRRIIQLLEQQLSAWATQQNVAVQYAAARIDAREVSLIRHQLGQTHPKLAKPQNSQQPVASHAIDAMCVLAAAANVPNLYQTLCLGEILSEDTDLLAGLLPNNITIDRIVRKPLYHKTDIASQALFKEGIYGEHFIPLWFYQGKVFAGFELSANNQQNALELSPADKKDKQALSRFVSLLHPYLKTNLPPEALLQHNTPCCVKINKQTAFELLYKVAKQPAAPHELQTADWLEALYYTTVKANIKTRLSTADNKKYASVKEVLSDKKFTINVALNNGIKVKGKLTLPAKQDWAQLLAATDQHKHAGHDWDERHIDDVITTVFAAGSKRPHHKVREKFSLPIIDGPSGGFRLRRRTPEGEYIWQLVAVEGSPSIGFSVSDKGEIDWKNTLLKAEFIHSPNLIPLNYRHQETPPTHTLPFDLWLPVESGLSDAHISIAPGTKDRRYIKVTQSITEFNAWTGLNENESSIALNDEVKIDSKHFQTMHNIKLLGKPRSNLFIENIGLTITYWYIVDSSNSDMNAAYQTAYTHWLEQQGG